MIEAGVEADLFVPPEAVEGKSPLSAFLSPLPARVAEHFASAICSDPDAWVVIPFSQSAAALLSVSRQARVVASDANPLTGLLQELVLHPPSPGQAAQVLHHLGGRFVQGQRLERYILRLYETSCPSCHRGVIADAFLWDRDSGRPVQRLVRCRECALDAWVRVSPEDLDRLMAVSARGYHYWRVLNRLAQRGEALYPLAQDFLGLYTARNLHALDALILESEVAFGEEPLAPLGDLARGALVGCLELCCSLQPGPGLPMPRRLHPPRRFLERNVWRVFEEWVTFWEGLAQTASCTHEGRVLLRVGSVRDALKELGEDRACLAVFSPPHPHPTFWHLSYFWTCWLLGKGAAERLRPLLYLAGPAWTWYVRALAQGLGATMARLEDGAPTVVSLRQDRYLAEAVVLAGLLAGCRPVGAAVQFSAIAPLSTSGARFSLVFQRDKDLPAEFASPPLEDMARRAALDLLSALEEPASIPQIWTAFYWRLASARSPVPLFERKDDLPGVLLELEGALRLHLAQMAREGVVESLGPLEKSKVAEGGEDGHDVGRLPQFWRRRGPWEMDFPLTDQVEMTVWKTLHEGWSPTDEELAQAIYRTFRGLRTPPAGWWEECLRAYGQEGIGGRWQLREEDRLARRQGELADLLDDLYRLGEALGFSLVTCPENLGRCRTAWNTEGAPRNTTARPAPLAEPFSVAWFAEGDQAYAFALSWTSSVVPVMVGNSVGSAGVQRCLVVPGGRSSLLHYRQTRAGWLPLALERGNWHFIKFRHLRQLASDPKAVSRSRLGHILGLDPIVERSDAQMPLF